SKAAWLASWSCAPPSGCRRLCCGQLPKALGYSLPSGGRFCNATGAEPTPLRSVMPFAIVPGNNKNSRTQNNETNGEDAMMKRLSVLALALLAFAFTTWTVRDAAAQSGDGWTQLFDGKSM